VSFVSAEHGGRGRPYVRFSLVQSTHLREGRPRVRVTRDLPDGSTEEQAVALARGRATTDPARRFQLLRLDPDAAEPRLVWDSHPVS
jgi:hypothetical protein